VDKLSDELQRHFFDEVESETVTLNRILVIAGERVFGFLFVLLALPSALPIPAPGFAMPFGVVLFVLAVQLMAGRRKPWLPDRLKQYPLELKQVQGFLKTGLPWLKRIEALSRPRMGWFCKSYPGRMLMGAAIALMAISMMIPIPLTNTLPAIGIFIVGFGLLDDDGFITLAGLVVCLMGALLTTSILVFGYTAVRATIDAVKGFVF
jgi:hypothetical protein